jgi:hypothetical protein
MKNIGNSNTVKLVIFKKYKKHLAIGKKTMTCASLAVKLVIVMKY